MNSNKCRLCNSKLFTRSLLQLRGMPKAAQHFPNKNEFAEDKGITLNVFQCTECSLVQLNIDPVDYFREVITAASFSEKTRLARLDLMKKFISRFHLQEKKILEVGSGKGDMLDILKDAGAVAIGIEASSESVEAGQSAGRKMVTGYIGEIDKIEGSPFDAFVSFNYIEHMPNPGVIINKIYNNMTTEGVGFVTVPNLEYLLRTKCFYEFVADHLSYFTKQTLKYAFESNNFKVLDCYTINNDNDILAVVKKKKSKEIEVSIKKKEPINISGYFKEVEDLMKNLNQIVNRYKTENKKIAVWGAGHRTLALLALSKLSKIDYIVDSAKFKQGKFSPVLHLRILPPETLQKEKVDLVIVMVPGIYPDEVISTVKKMDVASDIAKLKDNKIEFI